jgi:hypothetical protein
MADTTLSSNIVTDPHTLQSTSRAIWERVAPRAHPSGVDTGELIKQLRLLFIDTHQGLFVFGSPDKATLSLVKNYARLTLERALKEVFEEEAHIELVLFDDRETSLAELVARYTPEQEDASPTAQTSPGQNEIVAGAPTTQTDKESPRLNKVQLALIQNSLRGVFTSPKRVVVVPGYLPRWLPYLGPLRASIVVACFQSFYLCHRSTAKDNLTFEAPGPLLAAVAGIAESSVWRHLDDPELGWFLKKVPYNTSEKRWIRDKKAGITKKRPTRFLFRSTTPLTPGDAQALYAYLMDLNIQDDPVGALTQLVRGEYRVEPRDVFPFPAPAPPPDWQKDKPEACLIHNVIFSALGIEAKLASKNLADLVDELVDRLLPPNDQLHISWYYLLHWQSLLGHGPGWATILLRDRCFYNRQTGELRDTVTLRGGYQELAGALGLQRTKTVREWFPAPHAQKDTVKSADLSSREALEKLSVSKRSFVKEYAAQFVEIIEAKADGRGQVSSFKAQVKLFDPLIPLHEALYTALFPLAQQYFSLTTDQKTAFLGAFDGVSTMDDGSVGWIVQETAEAVQKLIQEHDLSIQAGVPCNLDDSTAVDLLGALEMITDNYLGANQKIKHTNLGAFEQINPRDSGAIDLSTNPDLGGFGRIIAVLSGAFGKIAEADTGAFERLGVVFWAYMRGLKYLVLNNHLDETLREYFENTERINSTTTIQSQDKDLESTDRVVEVEKYRNRNNWDLNQLLNNFSPQVKRMLLEKGVTVEALLSSMLYIASSKGDNLGLGYVVEKLKLQPQQGQGGIYRRIAEETPQEIIARLRSYVEYRSFQNRDWRVAMGTPSTEKILELLEHLGIDSSQFGDQGDW